MKKKIWKRFAAVALAAMMIFGLTACGSSSVSTGSGSDTTSTAESSSESVLRIGELWAIDSIDPVTEGTLIKEKALVTEVLCEVNANFELEPGLATEWTNTDDDTWVFTLRQGVKFHDGTTMDAKAVAWSINNALTVDPALVTTTNIKSVTATGDYEVTIVTSKPNSELPEFMHLSEFGIIAPSSYDSDGNLLTPIGTGPYKVDSFDDSTGVLTVVRNDDYYGTEPSVSKVVITGMTDPDTRALALESGEVDFTCDVPFNDVDYLDSIDNVYVEKYDTARTYCINLNCGGLFSDKTVREAASLAIDRQTISDDVLDGCGSPSKSMYTDNMAWCNTDIDGSTFDLNQAKQLMAEAGWTDSNGDGYLDKDGQTFEFTLITYTQRPGLPLIAEALQSQLKALGMKVDITTMDSSAVSPYIKDGNEWGMYLSASATCMAPSCVYFLQSKYYSSNSSMYGYSSSEMDALIDQCEDEFDTNARYQTSKQIQALAMEDLPVIYVCNYGVTYGFSSKVSNFQFNPTAHDYMWNVDIKVS